jgi:divalent metal cation (Fe/Co/Zn/Cd) transporter
MSRSCTDDGRIRSPDLDGQSPVSTSAGEVGRLRRRGFRLEYATMTWMAAEGAVAITAGLVAASIALVGFGLDSVIELFSAAIVIWQLRGEIAGQDRQTRAVRLIGVTFFALAAYLTVDSIRDLAAQARPGQSVPGLAVTGAALIVMPVLAVAKRRTGQALGNRTLVADSAETAFCAFTSAAALLGVGLNAWLGWWWADPAAALLIAALAVKEGVECWQQEDGA